MLMLKFILISTLVLISCVSAQFPSGNPHKVDATSLEEKSDEVENTSFSDTNINQEITIVGIAQNARLGAIVMTDDLTPIFLDGIIAWENDILGKSITVTGILRRKSLAPQVFVSPNGEISHGVNGDSYILENPSWKATQSRKFRELN